MHNVLFWDLSWPQEMLQILLHDLYFLLIPKWPSDCKRPAKCYRFFGISQRFCEIHQKSLWDLAITFACSCNNLCKISHRSCTHNDFYKFIHYIWSLILRLLGPILLCPPCNKNSFHPGDQYSDSDLYTIVIVQCPLKNMLFCTDFLVMWGVYRSRFKPPDLIGDSSGLLAQQPTIEASPSSWCRCQARMNILASDANVS